jgi:hypothetical protein
MLPLRHRLAMLKSVTHMTKLSDRFAQTSLIVALATSTPAVLPIPCGFSFEH